MNLKRYIELKEEEYKLQIKDEQTGLSCKKDDSDFSFQYLRKI